MRDLVLLLMLPLLLGLVTGCDESEAPVLANESLASDLGPPLDCMTWFNGCVYCPVDSSGEANCAKQCPEPESRPHCAWFR